MSKCIIGGCEKSVYARERCQSHYRQFIKVAGTLYTRGRYEYCTVEGCGRKHKAHGFCDKHNKRYLKHGSPLVGEAKQEHHGLRKHPLYEVWKSMRQRCNNPKAGAYKWYGAKGVRVCERWNSSFKAFYDDMIGSRPSPEYSIDRKDNDGNYSCGKCPECSANGWLMNVKWSTMLEQSHNTGMRRNNTSGYRGVTLHKGKWCARITVSYERIQLGYFRTRKEASAAYEAAKLRYHGGGPLAA